MGVDPGATTGIGYATEKGYEGEKVFVKDAVSWLETKTITEDWVLCIEDFTLWANQPAGMKPMMYFFVANLLMGAVLKAGGEVVFMSANEARKHVLGRACRKKSEVLEWFREQRNGLFDSDHVRDGIVMALAIQKVKE